MSDEITKEEAIALSKTSWWTKVSKKEAATFQLFTPCLCMPFDVFQEYLEHALGRPVFTHELGLNYEGIKKEIMGEAGPPTFEEIIGLIPEDKRVIIVR